MTRIYFTNNKTKLALAYGFRKEETLVRRIKDNVSRLNEEQTLKLGVWTGNTALLPDQVEIIVYLLGTPSEPGMVYSEKREESQ